MQIASSSLIRLALATDAAAVAAVYAPYVRDTIISFETEPPDAAEMARRITSIGERFPWLVAADAQGMLGYAYACEHRSRAAYRWDVDVAVYLHPRAHRRGVGRELYRRLFALLRAQAYINAYAGIALPNAASVGLHEAMGFLPVGVYAKVGYKHGGWHDVGWWALRLQRPPPHPDEPVPFPLLDRDAVRKALQSA